MRKFIDIVECLTEARVETVPHPFSEARELRLWVNPTASDIIALASQFSLRGLTDTGGDVFVWNARAATHVGGGKAIKSAGLGFDDAENPMTDDGKMVHFFVHNPNEDLPHEWEVYAKPLATRDGIEFRVNDGLADRIPENPKLSAILKRMGGAEASR